MYRRPGPTLTSRGFYCLALDAQSKQVGSFGVPCGGSPGGPPHGLVFDLAGSQLVARERRAERAVHLGAVSG